MKIKLLPIIIGISLCILAINSYAQNSYYQASVYFKSGVTRNITPTDTSATITASDVFILCSRYAIPTNYIRPAFPEFKESDTLVSIPETGKFYKIMNKAKVFTITVSDTNTLKNLIVDLNNLPEVLFAEENGLSVSCTSPNDPNYSNQWGLHNAQYTGHDIHAEGAWAITTGNPNSIIGVIDEGVQISHPDLQAKIIGGDNSFNINNGRSHGTEMASTIAASTNNAVGAAGVDWQAKILPEDKTDYWICFCINFLTKPHGDVLISKKISSAINFSPNVWTLNHSYALVFKNGKIGRTSFVVRSALSEAYKKNILSSVATGNEQRYELNSYPASANAE
jgi:subtilisin family serine protease